jgi:hypothetical protein
MKYRVIQPWQLTYVDPIILKENQPVELTGKTDNWAGHVWLWAINAAGQEGWIPDNLVRSTTSGNYATANYLALELTCDAGELLLGLEERHGWVRCQAGFRQKTLNQLDGATVRSFGETQK